MKYITDDDALVKALNKLMRRLTPCETTLGARFRENLRRFVHEHGLDHDKYHFAARPLPQAPGVSTRSCIATRHEAGRPATRAGGGYALCEECWQMLKEKP